MSEEQNALIRAGVPPQPGHAPAAYATPYNPGARNDLKEISRVAKLLGKPLVPWQRYVCAVATERDARDPRKYRYPLVVITVPRQSGKTTLVGMILASRMLTRRRNLALYTAQTGKDARDRFTDLANDLTASTSPLNPFIRYKRGIGNESLECESTGSRIKMFAPTPKSVHGNTPNTVVLDEVFAYSDALGSGIWEGVHPAMQTLRDRQILIISTAGDPSSTWLRRHVENGREAVGDPAARIAYFEWSAPEHLDLTRRESWLYFHPGAGVLTELDTLLDAPKENTPSQLARSYANRWVETKSSVIDLGKWEETIARNPTPPKPGEMYLAYEVAQFDCHAAIVASWKDEDTEEREGRVHIHTVASRDGIDWLIPTLKELIEKLKPKGIWADDGGNTRAITDKLRLEDVKVRTLRATEFSSATTSFINAVETGKLDHDDSPEMRQCVLNAALKPMSDSWVWSRRTSAGPIDDLVAATVAYRAAVYAKPPLPPPMIYAP